MEEILRFLVKNLASCKASTKTLRRRLDFLHNLSMNKEGRDYNGDHIANNETNKSLQENSSTYQRKNFINIPCRATGKIGATDPCSG